MSLPLRVAVRRARDRGIKIGFIRLKWFRPFATEEIRAALSRFKAVAVIDRDYSYGSPGNAGVLFNEVRSALYPVDNRPMLFPFICGLGGREIHQGDVVEMIEQVQQGLASGDMNQQTEWIGVRRYVSRSAPSQRGKEHPCPRAVHLGSPHLSGLRIGVGDAPHDQGGRPSDHRGG